MTFWNFFFNNKQTNTIKNKIKNTDTKIFIENLIENKQKLIIYSSTDKDVNLHDLEKLCDSVGWVKRPIKKVKIAIDNSFLIIAIFYYKEDKKNLIGFARATSDESFNATIWDVVIHPEFQGKGLGKALMQETIKQLRYHDISTITLFADPEVIQFYKGIGFVTDPDGVKGMFWYPI
uniref:Uncharacterized N-acetyltransferase Ycf52 n=1 Tax=Laurencia australis TaxID=3073067 RepID=A0AA51RD33_9FLOR|nr:Uncharacterized N-acetyltransferase Ycf52 [Laurencia australis]WMP11944.1 Uncharacterized N-acetyltransferase Ycf52 [Laurencia australis]